MKRRSVVLASLAAIVAALPASAQLPTGMLVMGIHAKLPDSLKNMPVPGGTSIDLEFTVMSDGHRVAVEIAPGAGLVGAMPMLQGIKVHAMYALGVDSLHAGVMLPPALAGGAPGYRVDVSLKTVDSLRRASSHLLDSFGTKLADSVGKMLPHPTYHSVGTTATVAGIRCEEWQTIVAKDTIETCVIPTPPMLHMMQEYVKNALGAHRLIDQVPGLSDAARQAYGGREMTSIRTTNARTGLRLELVSFTSAAPDAARFDLPPNLQPFPGGIGTKPPGGSGTNNHW
ncbi:MAG: hypothetical protein ACRELE_10085 [Gemmatimonadales bacterium]